MTISLCEQPLSYVFAMVSRSSYIPFLAAVSSGAMECPGLATATATVQPAVLGDTVSAAHFLWFLEIAPADSTVFANQLILQSNRRDGIWFVPDDSQASWRPGSWEVTQAPDAVSTCFAWMDGVRVKQRTYTRHPSGQFFVSGTASSGDLKLLVPRSPKGLWSHVLPDPLRHVDLAQCYSAPAGHGVTSRPGVLAVLTDAHEVAAASSEEPAGWTHVQGYETRCVHMLEASTPVRVEVSPGLCNGNGAETSAKTLPLPGPFCFTASGTLLFDL